MARRNAAVGDSPAGSLPQRVASAIEEKIFAEHMPAGARVGLRSELITQFAVSASVMSEALGILRERNLIEVKPGPGGGVFVTNPPPQVRLGAVDVWHQRLGVAPDELFEARAHLDTLFVSVALQRATPQDIGDMEWALDEIRAATNSDAAAWMNGIMRLHLAIARASRIPTLVGLYEAITSILTTTMSKAAFVEGSDELRRHNLEVHAGIVAAIRDRDSVALEKLMILHDQDMNRPGRSF